jgi:hypothetical protein
MRSRGTRSFAVALAAAALLAGVTGCTMCPDPHDYSGPVPNGSAPQNDFRVRSNGILPTGATALPWPPVVKAGADRPQADAPSPATIADEEPLVADAETPDSGTGTETDVVRLSAEEDPSPDAVIHAGVEPDAGMEEVASTTVELEPADDVAADDDVSPADDADGVPASAGDTGLPAPLSERMLRETPGWRSRR